MGTGRSLGAVQGREHANSISCRLCKGLGPGMAKL